MKVTKSKTRRLLPRGKFYLLSDEFLKEEDKCSWNRLRAGEKAVDIDSKALLEGNGLTVPNGHSATTFIEQELGVDVVKSTKKENEIVGAKDDDAQQWPETEKENNEPEPENPDMPEKENETEGVED